MSRTEALQFINVAHFFDHFFLLIFPTAALAIAPAWGQSYADVLLMGSPIYVMFALGTLPAGWLGDRMDRMTLIAIFYLGCGAASIWVALASGPVAMSVGLGALGLFAAIYHPVGLAHVTQIGLRTGRALAVNGVFGNMGLAGAAVITGFLARYLGWQWAFLGPGCVSVLLGLAVLWRNGWPIGAGMARDHAAKGPAPAHDRKTQLTVFAVICLAALLGGLIFNAVTISLPKFFDERLVGAAGNLAWVGASAGLVFAIAAFTQLPVGELLDRIGARPILLTLLGVQAVAMMLLAQATGLAALVLALVLVTFIFAQIPITSWLIGHYLAADIRSRALSVEYVLSLGVGSVSVPLLAAILERGAGFANLFPALAVAAVLTLLAVLRLPQGTVAGGHSHARMPEP